MKKKKILIILLVLLVTLSVVFATISCGGPKPNNNNNNNNNNDDDDDDDDDDVGFSEVFDAIKGAADQTVVNVKGLEDEAYFAATVYAYLKVGAERAMNYSLTIKGNFSDDVSKNEGYILIKDVENNIDLVQVYVNSGSNVFIKELATQKAAQSKWYKLDQASGTEFVKEYFSKLPGEISNMMKDANDNAVSSALGDPLVSTIGSILFNVLAPQSFDVDNSAFDGDYTLSVNFTNINSVVPLLSKFGLNINELATTISGFLDMELEGAALKSVADVIFPMLLGMKVVVDGDGNITGVQPEGVQPEIAIKASIAQGALSAIGLEYKKADDNNTENGNNAIDIRFGVKDVTVGKTLSAAALTPSGLNMATAVSPDIQLTLDLGMAGKTGLGNVIVTGYISPSISWSEADGFNVSNVKGYASATIEGIDGDIAISYDAQDGVLAFDLTGVYEALDIDVPAEGAIYYNDTLNLDELLNGKDEEVLPPQAPANAEPENKIDQLVGAILGIFSDNNIMAVVAQAGNAMELFNLAKQVLDVSINRDTDGVFIVDVLGLMTNIITLDNTNNHLLSGSEYLDIAGHNFTEYLVKEDTLQLIEEAAGWDEGTIGKWVVDISGQDVSSYTGANLTEKVTSFLIEKGLKIKLETFFGNTLDNTQKGAGFKLSLTQANGTSYAYVGLRGTLVQHNDNNFGTINITNGIDIHEDAGWEFFLDQLEVIGDAYLALA